MHSSHRGNTSYRERRAVKPKTREQYQAEYEGQPVPDLQLQLETMTFILEQNQEALRSATHGEGKAFWQFLVSQNLLEIEVIKSFVPAVN